MKRPDIIPELGSKLWSMMPVALLAMSIAVSGCSSTPNAPAPQAGATPTVAQSVQPAKNLPPMKEGEKAVVDRILFDWRFTTEHVSIPPLSSLNWRTLKAGTELPSPSVLITDKGAGVTLHAPLSQFLPYFVDVVKNGQVVGYQVVGDKMEIQVLPESIYPIRPEAGITKPDVRSSMVVAKVSGTAIYSPDAQILDKTYSGLQAHFTAYKPLKPDASSSATPDPTPSLAAANVHLKRGLGIRGRDVKPMTDVVERLKLETPEGVYVDAVFPGSPAATGSGVGGGLLPGDVILHIDNNLIRSREDLKKALDAAAADGRITIEFVRLVRPKNASELTREEIEKLSAPQKFNSAVTLAEVSGDANYIPKSDVSSVTAPSSPRASSSATP